MSNQLISSEYLYKGKIYYYLVKYPICPGNKQIYNFVLCDDGLRNYCINQTCVLCSQCLTIFGMEKNKLRKL